MSENKNNLSNSKKVKEDNKAISKNIVDKTNTTNTENKYKFPWQILLTGLLGALLGLTPFF